MDDGANVRRSELRLAVVGVIGIVLGAGIGVGGSLLTATTQAGRLEDQSKCDFLRGQRQDAYTRLMTDSVTTNQRDIDFYDNFLRPDAGHIQSDAKWVADDAAIGAGMKQIVLDAVAIRIVGPADASDGAYALSASHLKMLHALRIDHVHMTQFRPNSTESNEIKHDYDQVAAEIDDGSAEFLRKANIDVASCKIDRIGGPISPPS